MNESAKTTSFVCVAAIMAAAAFGMYMMNQPSTTDGFELVGQPFYENFTSSKQATSLEVVAMDPDSAKLQKFSVKSDDGIWRIPSAYDYPAEAAERLAQTASSFLGTYRESLASRLSSDHGRFGVIDPLGEELSNPEKVGKRLTLKDEDDDVLVDYIIGNEAVDDVANSNRDFSGASAEKYYYVRCPDENETYKVRLNVSLSTKFSDWIEPDLLKLESNDLRIIRSENYSLEEQVDRVGRMSLVKVEGDNLEFIRQTGLEDWTSTAITDPAKELDVARVEQVAGALTGLKIVGVRPKFKYKDQNLLGPNLDLVELPELRENPRLFQQIADELQGDLSEHGYNFTSDPATRKLILVSNFGDMQIATEDGMLYKMYFGRSVDDEEVAINFGPENKKTDDQKSADAADTDGDSTDSDATDSPEPEKAETDGKDAADSSEPAEEEGNTEESKNRFLMISVQFSQAEFDLFNKPEQPTAPTEPAKPDGYVPFNPEADDDAAPSPGGEGAKENKNAENKNEQKGADSDPKDDSPEEAQKDDRDPAFIAYDDALKKFEVDKAEFDLAMTRFEDESKTYNETLTKSQEKALELNQRFGDWFYVISADNLKSLRVSLADVMKEKSATPSGAGGMPPGGMPFGGGSGGAGNIPPEIQKMIEEAQRKAQQNPAGGSQPPAGVRVDPLPESPDISFPEGDEIDGTEKGTEKEMDKENATDTGNSENSPEPAKETEPAKESGGDQEPEKSTPNEGAKTENSKPESNATEHPEPNDKKSDGDKGDKNDGQ